MGDLKIRCVKVHGHPETRALIEEAFKCSYDEKILTTWFTEDECFTIKTKQKHEVYVFDVFDGEAFEHISGLGCRVIGPLCLITSLVCKKDIPRTSKPIYNLAMKDIILCCTNVVKELRDPLHDKVELMGGMVTRDFTADVTHLVASCVGSKKYLVAGSNGKQIMLPTWVDEVWKKSKLEAVHGNDEQFQELKCPIFMGLVITVSGLNTSEKNEAKNLIEKEGGKYSGEMKVKECTHLIVNEPKGQKYNFAKKWEIHIVRSEWLYESIEKGFCQDEANYPVTTEGENEGKMKTSTPERQSGVYGNLTDLNNISMISMATVNETAMNNVTNMTRLEDPLFNLDLTKAPEDLFLDGCKIYLSGFRGPTLERLRKIINCGGGTRCNQISDNLTHVVVGEKINSDIETMKSLSNRPHFVTSQWLVDCYKEEKLLEETKYLASEISQQQQQPKTPENRIRRRTRGLDDTQGSKPQTDQQQQQQQADDDMHDIMSQYLDQPKQDTTKSDDTTMAPIDLDNDMTQDPDKADDEGSGIFHRKTFIFYGFPEDGIPVLSSYIAENGGSVLKLTARGVPDYAVVPIDGFPVDRTVKDIVTNAWLQICIENGELQDIRKNPLFTPIEFNVESPPLTGCVLSISGYIGTERDSLVSIADVLGATIQDYLVRNAKNDLLPSTHLVVNAPAGSKYTAAKKWGIPAISKLWILACAHSGKRENEERFMIDTIEDDNLLDIASLVNKPVNDKLKATENDCSINKQGTSKNVPADTFSNCDKNGATGRGNISVNQSASNKTETSLPNFSATGDTEALLAELDTQPDHDTTVERNETVSKPADNDVDDGDNDVTVEPENNDIDKEHEVDIHSVKNNGDGRNSVVDNKKDNDDDNDDDDDEVVIVNKNLTGPKYDEKKTETPPLTRFMRNLAKNPPAMGTPNLTKLSVRQKLMGEHFEGWRTIERKKKAEGYIDDNADTPPLKKFMKKIEQDPPQLGTPVLTTMSAREKLMGKGYQGWRTIERKKKQEEQRQHLSQKENLQTPVQSRLKELKNQEDKDTPSKFLNPNVRYFPKFETEELLKALETPEAERLANSKKKKDSLDDDELVELAKSKAMKTLQELHEARQEGRLPSTQNALDETDGDSEESTILQGVVIIVGKKLTKDQSELNDLVASLGGDYRWNYDTSCTHFIFQGRQNDTAKDFKHAKSQGMKIVSPHWLYMCKEQNARVEESLFPHTFNPNLSLSVVSTRKTPMRTPRTRRMARTNVDNVGPSSSSSAAVVVEDDDDNKTKQQKTVSPKPATPKQSMENLLKSPDKSSSDDDKQNNIADVGTGSLEMREVLSKQLEDVMSKGRKRRKSKKLNNSGQFGTPEDSSNSSLKQSRRTQEGIQKKSTRTSRNLADEQNEERNSCDIGPSQPVHVSWDDPMSRLEQEKLAHKLERANSPTQEVGGMYDLDPEDAQYSESDGEIEIRVPKFDNKQNEEISTPKLPKSTVNKTPTPEGPSIAFPVSNKSSKVTPPKPVNIESTDDDITETSKSVPVFMFSQMSTTERTNYGALVEQLGGTVLDTQEFDSRCTHLVVNNVTRNEKFLACLASGKWILHKSYFEACRQEGRFVEEEFYEWGSEGTLSLAKNMESNVRLLAVAARDWRIKIQEQKKISPNKYGAFCSMKVVLNCAKHKEGNYKRLLEAGGATVLNLKPPYSGPVDATHALLEIHKVEMKQEDLEILLSSGCLCLKIDYINGFLCSPDVNVKDYVPAEVAAIQAVMNGEEDRAQRKRKVSSGPEVSQKRTRKK
ncbi:DNA topoisomerase 2-binding protein 1 [Mactra antiquata]